MNANKRTIALAELLLILPAALFMVALLVRHLQPLTVGPAQAAQRTVMWYVERQWTLWILLITMPIVALVTGGATLLQSWEEEGLREAFRQPLAAIRAHLAMFSIAAVTCTAAGVLAIVAPLLHLHAPL